MGRQVSQVCYRPNLMGYRDWYCGFAASGGCVTTCLELGIVHPVGIEEPPSLNLTVK